MEPVNSQNSSPELTPDSGRRGSPKLLNGLIFIKRGPGPANVALALILFAVFPCIPRIHFQVSGSFVAAGSNSMFLTILDSQKTLDMEISQLFLLDIISLQ